MSDLMPVERRHNYENPRCPKCGNATAKRGVVNQVWATVQAYRCTECGKRLQKVIRQKLDLFSVLHNTSNPHCPECGHYSRKSGKRKMKWTTVQRYKCIGCGTDFQKKIEAGK